MTKLHSFFRALGCAAALCFVNLSSAATVDAGTGYTNDFSVQPAAADWSTLSVPGVAADITTLAALEAVVQTNAARSISNSTISIAQTPPIGTTVASWSGVAAGLYLQTRPSSGNSATLLMATLANNTGTNAGFVHLSYDFTTNRAAGGTEEIRGQVVYYSLFGTTNSWIKIPELSQTAQGTLSIDLTLAGPWTNGSNLFLLWVDDNGSSATDGANDIDNFYITVTGAALVPGSVQLLTPTNGQIFITPANVSISADVRADPGTTITGVGYYDLTRGLLGSTTVAPYQLTKNLSPGIYQVYAVETNTGRLIYSDSTNSIQVVDPLGIALAAPASGANFNYGTAIGATGIVSGGASPFTVRFYADGVLAGVADGNSGATYYKNLGALFFGGHTVQATVTDANGWVSNSTLSSLTITGRVFASLEPTNGASFNFGQPITLTGYVAGGIAPYSVAFFTNGVSAGGVGPGPSPFSVSLGILPVGTYTGLVFAADTIGDVTNSAANVISVLPNPLVVTLSSPTNGQTPVAGVTFTPRATVTVGGPVTVASVEFFFDGVSAGVDTNAPFAGSVPGPSEGLHSVYAVATDSLGRIGTSATNTVTFISDPLVNNNFVNRITLGTPGSAVGNNTDANTEGGEPTFQGGFGQPFITWGATLWYRWVAPFSGTVTIDTFGSSIDTVLSVYTGQTVNNPPLVQRNNDAPGAGTDSLVSFSALAGTEYQIQVGGQGGGFGGGQPAQGAFRLNLSMPPSVTISNPVSGAVFPVGTPVTVEVGAQSPAGGVTNVSLYRGTTLLGSLTTPPYTFTATNLPPGSNLLSAVARDAAGQAASSPIVQVLMANLGVTITTPIEDRVFGNTAPINISAYTSLPSGSVTNVDFFLDGQFLAGKGTAPFSVVWSNVTGGSHRLTATGRDDSGNTYQANAVNFGVSTTFVASNSVWKYLDDGSDQGTAWYAPNFNDSAWGFGPAPLGFGDSNGRLPLTTNSFGPNPNAKYTNTYYRQAFIVSNLAAYSSFTMNIQRDDGAIVYLNGTELARFNMPTGMVTSTTFASANAADDGGTTFTTTVSPSRFVEGTNVFAVEIHQDVGNSSDIWFVMELLGTPIISHNASPEVAITSPTNNQYFVSPPSITLSANATDSDGSVTNVDFFVDGVKLGRTTIGNPYQFTWNSPPVGPHTLTAVASDNVGVQTVSVPITVVVFNASGTPVASITSPVDGATMEGPTNLPVRAVAYALAGVTNVQFLSNGVAFASDDAAPYSAVWPYSFLSNGLQAVAIDANGVRGTSPVVRVTITIPPTNTVPPTIVSQAPLAFATVSNANFTNLTVTFSERVQGVDASDLLINAMPATSVSGSGSNYTFTFPRPPYGEVNITFAYTHGITDFGYPANLPYNELDGSGSWEYEYIDTTPPSVAAKVPAAGSTVTNLTSISVTFSELVSGVDASDLLVNGVEAFSVAGGGSNYVFDVIPPASGTVSVSWATNHGIVDFAVGAPPNSFNRTASGNTWAFTLDSRTTFVQSNSTWRFIKGLAEASDPTNAWRQMAFDDSSWSNSPAPFFYGDPYTNFPAGIVGTLLSDMRSNYTTIYLRKEFVVQKVSALTNLLLNAQSDDGFVAWINGVEVLRYNSPAGEIPYTGTASSTSPEPNQTGAAYIIYSLTNLSMLVNGTNILAVQALNDNLTTSTDFGFNAQLYSFVPDPGLTPPRLTTVSPAPGELFALTSITVTFSESVTNVDVGDLLVNGAPATGLSSGTNTTYTFSFAQPAYGSVAVTWAVGHGIVDFDTPAKPFDGNAASAKPNYTLVNPSAPNVFAQSPISSATITGLTSIAVTFTEPVTGVDAADLLVNNVGATGLTSPSPTNFVFTFPQPAYGAVTVRWTTNNAIRDVEAPANDFERTRPGNQWNYTLVNPFPTVTFTSPTNNAYVLAPANIPLRVTATDNDGSVVLVEYFDKDEEYKIGEATAAPYSVTWDRPLGTYRAVAVATDNTGLKGTSAPVTINVVTEIPPQLTRGPYLQSGSSTGAVVRWRTDLSAGTVVRYGTNLNALSGMAVGTNTGLLTEHVVALRGLQPNTKYFYSVGSTNLTIAGGAVSGSDHWFVTSPLPGTAKPTRFWVLGDPGTGNANQQAVRDSYYNFATTNRPADFWLMLGDNAYNTGLDTEYQSAVFNMYPGTLRNLFLWPVIGNHDAGQPGTGGGSAANVNLTGFPYLDIFSLPFNGEAGGLPTGNPKYYSFDYANIHFVALDSMSSGRETNSPMVLWLQDDLAATTQTWTIVFFHHSLYTHGTHNSDTEADLIAERQVFNPILEAYGVDLVLMGHSHVYERSYLLDGHYGLSSTLTPSMKIDGGNGREDGTGAYRKNSENRGVVYNIVGCSGQALGGTLDHPAHVVSLNLLGSLLVDVNGDRLDANFLTSTGTSGDHYTLIKSAQSGGSTLVINSITASGGSVNMTFHAQANQSYTIERAPSLNNWQTLQSFSAVPSNRVIQFVQPVSSTNEYFRLRTP